MQLCVQAVCAVSLKWTCVSQLQNGFTQTNVFYTRIDTLQCASCMALCSNAAVVSTAYQHHARGKAQREAGVGLAVVDEVHARAVEPAKGQARDQLG